MFKAVFSILATFIMLLNFSQVSASEVADIKQNVTIAAGGDFSQVLNSDNVSAMKDQNSKPEKFWKRDGAKIGLYILAIFIPFVAVGIHTDWGMPTLWNVLWSFLGGIPGIIHAFIVLGR